MTKKVYILRCNWYICLEGDHDNVAVYDNKLSACKALKKYVDNEKSTVLTDFFSNGELISNNYVDDYEERDDYFFFTTKCGEYNIKVYIESFDMVSN